jgi:hypothetical protein
MLQLLLCLGRIEPQRHREGLFAGFIFMIFGPFQAISEGFFEEKKLSD